MLLKLILKISKNTLGMHRCSYNYFSGHTDRGFVERVVTNTARYIALFSQAIDTNMPSPSINFNDEDLSTFDIIMQQRKSNLANAINNAVNSGMNIQNIDPKNILPPELERQYQVFIVNGPNAKKSIRKMRDIKSEQIGSLVTVKGIVTRAADVKPCL
jgi:DNA replication licensing factor MCM7